MQQELDWQQGGAKATEPAPPAPATGCAEVAIDLPGHDSLTYQVPEDLDGQLRIGDAVEVPLQRRKVQGFVVAFRDEAPTGFRIKPIIRQLEHVHLPAPLLRLLRWLAGYYRCDLGSCLVAAVPAPVRDAQRMRAERRVRVLPAFDGKLTKRQAQVLAQLPRDAVLSVADAARRGACSSSVIDRLVLAGALQLEVSCGVQEVQLPAVAEWHLLTEEQQLAVAQVTKALEAGDFAPFLLYGVTGSGKTLVYMQLAQQVIEQGKQVLLLLPEIALTPQLAARFRQRFERVVVWHSGFTGGERHEHWQQVARGEVDLVIGTRSALFAPLPQIGLIVVDEEHDSSYKQDQSPRYHGRDVAVVYARQLGVPVILGSATPCAETTANARGGKYTVLILKDRPAGGRLPTPLVVDMREECRAQHKLVTLSRALVTHLQEVKACQDQAIVLLNRRGWSPVVHCVACGQSMSCPSCDVTLTYHRRVDLLRCHYCGYETGLPGRCPICQEAALSLHGMGTEQLTQALRDAVPGLRVLRLDADTVRERQGHAKVLQHFANGEHDVLVGTQMVAKGLNFPRVTVVGVIAADAGLSQPDFRAAERSYQLICQVAGRAGRGKRPGVVVVQAFDPEAAAIQCAIHARPRSFFNQELALREEFGYPPCTGLVRFIWTGASLATVERLAQAHGELILAAAGDAVVLPPGPAAIAFLKGQHRWHALLKAGSRGVAQQVLDRLKGQLKSCSGVRVSIDVDPYSFS
jgi:primosomal protein N' (replication factor Y) (superfamily II helicase)